MAMRGRPRKNPAPAATGRRMLTLEEAGERLAYSPYTLRDWALAGKIASHKIGGKLLISDAELERIIAESERPRITREHA